MLKKQKHLKRKNNTNTKQQGVKTNTPNNKEIDISESNSDSSPESEEFPEEEIEEQGEKQEEEQEEIEEHDNEEEEEQQDNEQDDEEQEEEQDNEEENLQDGEEQTNNKKAPKQQSPPLDPNNNGIFISGIPYNTPSSTLHSLFSQFGSITSLNLPKYQDSNRNIGYAHIYFSTASSAHKALSLNKHTLNDRYITVEPAKYSSSSLSSLQTSLPKTVPPSSCVTAFIKNLPYTITEKEVGDKFRSCGKIKSIRFVYNSKTNHFKGFCYIDFVEHHGLLKALELNGKQLQGRVMKVDFEEQKPKKGYKYAHTKMAPEYNREYMKMLNIKRKKKTK